MNAALWFILGAALQWLLSSIAEERRLQKKRKERAEIGRIAELVNARPVKE